MPNRDYYIITKLPPEQYSNTKIKFIEKGEEIIPLNEYQNAAIVFDDFLGPPNIRYTDPFLKRGNYNNSGIYYLSQSIFDFPKR